MVGPCLCERLGWQAVPFRTLGRRGPPAGGGIVGDLSRPDQLRIDGRFDVLIHMAPLWLLPDNLARLVTAGVGRIVAFSSTSAASKRNSTDAGDRALADALVSAEDRLRADTAASGIALTLFRPTMIYGYGRDANVMAIARLIRKLGFFPVAGPAKGRRQPVHADDLAAAALACMASPLTAGRTYDLTGAETLRYGDMVKRIFEAMGRTPRVLHIAPSLYRGLMAVAARAGLTGGASAGAADRMNEDLCFDSGPAQSDFGYRASTFLADPRRDLPL